MVETTNQNIDHTCTVVFSMIISFSTRHLNDHLPSGKHTKNYGKSPFLMGTSTISIAIFNSKLLVITRPGIRGFCCDSLSDEKISRREVQRAWWLPPGFILVPWREKKSEDRCVSLRASLPRFPIISYRCPIDFL